MKKILPNLVCILLVSFLVLTACAPSEGLSGAAGGGGEEVPDTEGGDGGNGGDNPPIEPPPVEPPPNSVAAEKFYLPTLTIVLSNDASFYTTGLSTTPMGRAEYQLTAPAELQLGVEHVIELIVVPDTLKVDKTKVFESVDENITQAFQGTLDIYPYMVAEIIAGDSFSIKPYNLIDQIVLDDRSTIWLWYITALQAGEHKLIASVSVPVNVDEIQSTYEMARIEFDIHVADPAPTVTPTIAPPTLTPPAPKITAEVALSDVLPATAKAEMSAQMLAVIAAVITLIAAVIPLYQRREKRRKTQADRDRNASREKTENQIKEDLHKPKNRK